ncbi:hypothetical protein DNTS_009333 [Danionella cerebrum]|uniref:PHD finger protein 13 n=1 Tax=Danionella cerebrum TaxID=2873325 RepID=A0A553QCI6_9TELE|nr:hypothetical protein DNTS_009333 [Danionella translucida]
MDNDSTCPFDSQAYSSTFKRKRTVEDFNKFCTFVLAYAGYIPYPQEIIHRSDTSALLRFLILDSEMVVALLSRPLRDIPPLNKTSTPLSQGKRATPVSPFSYQTLFLSAILHNSSEAHLRNSLSPPNSTGSTVDSDGWDNQRLGGSISSPDEPQPKSRKSFPGFKRLSSEDSEPQNHPRSGGLLLEGRTKADKVKKKKLKKCKDQKLRNSTLFSSSETPSLGCAIKEEPEDYLSIPIPESGMHPKTCSSFNSYGTTTCKEETDVCRPCWSGLENIEELEKPSETKLEAMFFKVEGHSGKRTVVRQGKQVVFRDEDGSADDEDIMVDSDDDSWDLVTCFCMKPFAGRAMIECNQCNTWVHLSCAKIRKSNVPETYICQRCKDSKFDIRRSNRSRVGSRKHLLD